MNTSTGRRVRHEIVDAISVAVVSLGMSVVCAALMWLALRVMGA